LQKANKKEAKKRVTEDQTKQTNQKQKMRKQRESLHPPRTLLWRLSDDEDTSVF
jgi:hypothetical protein